MKINSKRYIQGFGLIVVILSFIRCLFPDIATNRHQKDEESNITASRNDSLQSPKTANFTPSIFFNADGTARKNRIKSVSSYAKAFPDQNDIQLEMAQKWGVTPVINREEAEQRKAELVYIGSNPYFYVDKLRNSIPYLVPRASVLLQDIGKVFFDSLQVKGVPLHKIIVTSVMRSKEDVQKLRGHNGNATENSCHLYGTTFDICYNRYKTVEAPDEASRRAVRNDTLKWILSEVLNDMRQQGRCYIKYEVHQGCFHITTR